MSPSVSARLLLTQSDARLVAFARAGHERAFEALVRRYRGPLLGYCRRLLLSEERAEDALQQALLQAWLALRAGTEVENAKPWLYRIVHNAALNALRVSGYDYCTLSESLSGADAPQEDLDRRIAVREALAGLAALPEMQREALLRTAVEGSTHRQAARDLGLSENALRGLVYRARTALRATAGAIVPPPLVSWALGSGGGGAPVGERLAELGVGGGSAGVAGLLTKGGTVAVTASMLAGGIAAVHDVHPKLSGKHPPSHGARHHAQGTAPRLALTASRSASVTPVADIQGTPTHAKSPSTHGPTLGTKRFRRRPRIALSPTAIAPPLSGADPDTHRDGGRHGRADGGRRDDRDRTQNPDSNGPGSGTNAAGGGDGRHHGGHREPTSSGSGRRDGEPGSSGDGPSGSGATGDSQDGGASSSGQGAQAADTSRPGASSDDRGSRTSSATTTNTSSKDGQDPASASERGA
jgi:RNA polymerase sigma factor (sigma-70 family)